MHAACASLPLDSSWQRSTAASSITRSVQHCVPADCWLAYLLHQQQAHTQSHVIIHPLQHNLGVGHQAAGRRKLWGRRHGRASQGGSASGCCQSSGGAVKQLRLHCSGQVPGNPHLICISTAPRSRCYWLLACTPAQPAGFAAQGFSLTMQLLILGGAWPRQQGAPIPGL